MRPFAYSRADAPEAAVRLASERENAGKTQFLAGGTSLVDLMKLDVMRPERLVDINPIAAKGFDRIEASVSGLRIGALARMTEVAENEIVLRDYPMIAQSLQLAASQQLRNMATIGGNVLQRTRCPYFRDVSWAACNKREPGSGCAAMEGVNRLHAVLGASEACIASYPGDFAQAMIALDASVEVLGPRGRRTLRFADLHRAPGATPQIETNLAPGELITVFAIPAGAWTKRSLYLKVRDRESYAFALTSAAVALALDGERKVQEVRIGLGGVATVPWRARAAEDVLKGRVLDEAAATEAAKAAFKDAKTHDHNAFKVPLGEQTIVRALMQAASLEI